MNLLRNAMRSNISLRSASGSRPNQAFSSLLHRECPRSFSTEAEQPPQGSAEQPPEGQESSITSFFQNHSGGSFSGGLVGITKDTWKTDIIDFLEGCNLTPNDIRVDSMLIQFPSGRAYNQAYRMIRESHSYKMEKKKVVANSTDPTRKGLGIWGLANTKPMSGCYSVQSRGFHDGFNVGDDDTDANMLVLFGGINRCEKPDAKSEKILISFHSSGLTGKQLRKLKNLWFPAKTLFRFPGKTLSSPAGSGNENRFFEHLLQSPGPTRIFYLEKKASPSGDSSMHQDPSSLNGQYRSTLVSHKDMKKASDLDELETSLLHFYLPSSYLSFVCSGEKFDEPPKEQVS